MASSSNIGGPTIGSRAPRAPRAPRGPGGIPLGRVAGVQIVADWSLFLIFALVAAQLGLGVLPSWHPNWSSPLVWGVALVAAVMFFASIVVHELSHAMIAKLHGIPVRRITLFMFGGVAHLDREPSSPRAELFTAAIGPVVSLVIGAAAIMLGWLTAGDAMRAMPQDPAAAFAAMGPVPTLLLWLGPVNVVLAIFNMVPGFPLDGGRVLRAVLWWSTGDLVKATRWASRMGVAVGVALIGYGLFSLLRGDIGSGMWLALIGWFLVGAAREAYRQLVVRHALEGVPIDMVMRREPDVVPPHATLEQLVHEHVMTFDQQTIPVAAEGELVGVVSMKDVREVARDRWNYTRVSSVMTPIGRAAVLTPRASAADVLEALARHDVDAVPIADGGRLVGIVRKHDLTRWLSVKETSVPE